MKPFLTFTSALAALFVAVSAHAAVLQAEIKSDARSIPLKLETAATEPERIQGLMGRKTLAPNDGMIFLFPEPVNQKFWMKDTLIPLDMLFVNAQGKIVYIAHGTPGSEMPLGPKKEEITAVVELDAGRAEKEGIEVGNALIYSLPQGLVVQ